MLSSVFRIKLPSIISSFVLRDLLRSFEVQRPARVLRPPSWDLTKVLVFLRGPPFEPLESASLRDLTRKTLFLVALATAKRVGEIQSLSAEVASCREGLVLAYLPEFVAKTESSSNPIDRVFTLRSLDDFVGNCPEEMLLCPVRALSVYMRRVGSMVARPRSLFLSPRFPSRGISKNAISFFLRDLIVASGAVGVAEGPAPRAHEVRSVATSVAFMRNWLVTRVLEAATWRSQSVFSTFYLRDVASTLGDLHSVASIIAAGQVVAGSE